MLLLPSLTRSRKISSTLALTITLLAASAARADSAYDFQTLDAPSASASGTYPEGISGSNVVGFYTCLLYTSRCV